MLVVEFGVFFIDRLKCDVAATAVVGAAAAYFFNLSVVG